MLPDGVELESRPCPVGCPPGDRKVVAGVDRIGGRPGLFPIVECATCGLMRTDPRPTPASIGYYYGDDYGPYAATAAPPPGGWKRKVERALGLDVRRLPPVTPGRMLEFGCASGNFMDAARRLGWEVEGIEFSDTAAEAARQRGFKVQASALEAASPPERPYDLVVAWMVVEHLHEPVEALRRLRSWTTPEGWLVLSVPDAGAFDRRLFGEAWYALHLPNHLYHFTPSTLRRMLAAAGWRMEKVRWQPNPNNLLMSLSYRFGDRGLEGASRAMRHLATAPRWTLPRLAFGWLLARMRQSGRMEIWARPIA